MDEQEKEEILYRLDERTKRVDNHLARLDNRVSENEDELRDLKSKTTKNTRDINYGKGLIGAIGTTTLALAMKVVGWIQPS
jgi:chaperonin cofactor prefoldin